MSIDPESGFEYFNTIPTLGPKYPNPLTNNVKLGGKTYPTNSWFQNAITDTIDDNNRFAGVIPWYWHVYYNTSKFGLSHNNRLPFINKTTIGNLQQIEQQPTPGINIYITGKEQKGIYLNKLDDYTAVFSDNEDIEKGNFYGYPCRGSPFATFKYLGQETCNIEFISFGIIGMTGIEGIKGGYIITTVGTKTTVVNTGFDDVGLLNKSLKELSFYDGINSLDKPITAEVNYNTGSDYRPGNPISEPYPIGLNVDALGVNTKYIFKSGVNTGNGEFIFIPEGGATGTANGTNVSINYGTLDGINYTISTNLDWNELPQIMTATTNQTVTYKWILYGPEIIKLTGSTISFSNYNGAIQIAAIDDDNQLETYIKYLGNYIVAGDATNFSSNGSFDINYSRVGPKQLLMLPNHWTSFNINGINPVLNISPYNNIIYGNMLYYEVIDDLAKLVPKNFMVPNIVDISKFNNAEKNLFEQQINTDAKFLANPKRNFIPNADPYSFGQVASAVGRLFLFAKELGMPLTGDVGDVAIAVSVVKNYLIAWMENKNITLKDGLTGCNCDNCGPGFIPRQNIYHLQRETTWGGIIVPADYLHSLLPSKICYPIDSYGNSFYSDHHFHWGYILYALACLEYIGQGISIQYHKQIKALMKDVVNPKRDEFSWKTRHKDWYTGHSWATGNTNESARQQESCSEAINCYYSVYLMSSFMGLDDIKSCSAVCLNLEIQACQNYYYLQAPGTKNGLMSKINAVGIIFNNSKQFTLDWGMQPDSFPGRSIGIYGIQCLPFTDISRIQIPQQWATSLSNSNEIGYNITQNMILSLCGTTGYTGIGIYDSDWKVSQPFNNEKEGTFWGFVGLKMLSFGSSINNITAQNCYNESISKQIKFSDPNSTEYFPVVKQFDTFSNTLYWLVNNSKWSNSGTSSLIFNSKNIRFPETRCSPIDILPIEFYLENSTLRDQGLINAPQIEIKLCYNSQQNNVTLAYFQIRDEQYYYSHKRLCPSKSPCCINENKCFIRGICPEKLVFTDLKSSLDITPMINAPGDNIYEKVNFIGNGVDFTKVLLYAYLKLILSRILYGRFNLKYLSQHYNTKFFKDLSCSRFCNFKNVFVEQNILDYNKYFV